MGSKKQLYWIQAARLQTLGVTVAPILMSAVLGYVNGVFHFYSVLAALLSAIWIQVGTNFANDYFDFKHGTDTSDRLGPVRATSAGLISPQQMKIAMIICFVLAVICASYIMWRGGMPIVIIGIASIIAGILYTGGPFPLGYNGLGDVFVLFFFGPVAVAGTYYVQALQWSLESLWLGLSPGLFSVAILVVNNLRDVEEDTKTGKRTLVVFFGDTFGKVEYTLCVIMGTSLPFIIDILYARSPSAVGFLALIPGFRLIRLVWSTSGSALNPILGNTSKLLLLFAILWSMGKLI